MEAADKGHARDGGQAQDILRTVNAAVERARRRVLSSVAIALGRVHFGDEEGDVGVISPDEVVRHEGRVGEQDAVIQRHQIVKGRADRQRGIMMVHRGVPIAVAVIRQAVVPDAVVVGRVTKVKRHHRVGIRRLDGIAIGFHFIGVIRPAGEEVARTFQSVGLIAQLPGGHGDVVAQGVGREGARRIAAVGESVDRDDDSSPAKVRGHAGKIGEHRAALADQRLVRVLAESAGESIVAGIQLIDPTRHGQPIGPVEGIPCRAAGETQPTR